MKKRTHQTAHANLNLVLHAFVRGNDVDLAEPQQLRDLVQIPRVPADTVDALHNDRVKASVAGCFEKLSKADATNKCLGRHGAVFKDGHLAVTFAPQIASAELHLIFNGAIRLEHGRISGINCCAALHWRFPLASRRAFARAISLTRSPMAGSNGELCT
nr:hypothetical protein [Roseinatronobacter thiooxidans]